MSFITVTTASLSRRCTFSYKRYNIILKCLSIGLTVQVDGRLRSAHILGSRIGLNLLKGLNRRPQTNLATGKIGKLDLQQSILRSNGQKILKVSSKFFEV